MSQDESEVLFPFYITAKQKYVKIEPNPSDTPVPNPVFYLNSDIVAVEYTGKATITCDHCPSLKFINSGNTNYVTCDDCPSLETINVEMAESIVVYDCASLKSIVCHKNLKYLRIKNCPLLETITDIDNIDQVRIDECPLLSCNGFWSC